MPIILKVKRNRLNESVNQEVLETATHNGYTISRVHCTVPGGRYEDPRYNYEMIVNENGEDIIEKKHPHYFDSPWRSSHFTHFTIYEEYGFICGEIYLDVNAVEDIRKCYILFNFNGNFEEVYGDGKPVFFSMKPEFIDKNHYRFMKWRVSNGDKWIYLNRDLKPTYLTIDNHDQYFDRKTDFFDEFGVGICKYNNNPWSLTVINEHGDFILKDEDDKVLIFRYISEFDKNGIAKAHDEKFNHYEISVDGTVTPA